MKKFERLDAAAAPDDTVLTLYGHDGAYVIRIGGADALTTAGNARLYRGAGVRTAAAALRPGGRLAYWSAGDDPALADALRRAGLHVEATRARARATAGPRHTRYVARLS